jgi:methyl-accepting chemotaxis protein
MFSAKWLKGLRGRLLFTSLLPVLGFILLAFFAIRSLDKINVILDEELVTTLPTVSVMGRMKADTNAIARSMWRAYALDDEAGIKSSIDQANFFIADFNEAKKFYETTKLTDEEAKMYSEVSRNWEKAQEAAQRATALLSQNKKAASEQAKTVILKEYNTYAGPVEKSISGIVDLYDKYAKEQTKLARETYQSTFALLIAISILASVSILLIMLVTAMKLANAVSGVADNLSRSSMEVGSSSEQLSAAGQELSSSSTQAAASLEETVSSLEELSSMVKLNADNAKEAAALSQNSRASAEEGEQEIRSLIESMTDISQSSKKIEEIINVIDDIAFQTNLLALNAAVEAARAGEQGKGFAVVAEAVRSLAQRSAAAAKDITVLIQDSVSKIERGTKIADQSGNVLKNIVTSVKKVADLNTEISSASQEQSSGITQISQAMNQLDQATQTNASSAEEVASSSEKMSEQAVNLRDLVGNLTAIVDGDSVHQESFQHVKRAPTVKPGLKLVASKPKAHKPVTKKQDAEAVIPLETGKVGTTDGF